jgi:hypothetical protein
VFSIAWEAASKMGAPGPKIAKWHLKVEFPFVPYHQNEAHFTINFIFSDEII